MQVKTNPEKSSLLCPRFLFYSREVATRPKPTRCAQRLSPCSARHPGRTPPTGSPPQVHSGARKPNPHGGDPGEPAQPPSFPPSQELRATCSHAIPSTCSSLRGSAQGLIPPGAPDRGHAPPQSLQTPPSLARSPHRPCSWSCLRLGPSWCPRDRPSGTHTLTGKRVRAAARAQAHANTFPGPSASEGLTQRTRRVRATCVDRPARKPVGFAGGERGESRDLSETQFPPLLNGHDTP